MIILFNENLSIGKKQLSFLKRIYSEIKLVQNQSEFLSLIISDNNNLVLTDGTSYNSILDVIREKENFTFLIFPPFPSEININNINLKIKRKKQAKKSIALYNKTLEHVFIDNGIKLSDINFHYSHIFEDNESIKIIKDDDISIFIKTESKQSIFFLTTIIVDQFSVLNEMDYIVNLNKFVKNYYEVRKEIQQYNDKLKSSKEQLFLFKRLSFAYKIVLITFNYFIEIEDRAKLEEEELWNKFVDILNKLRSQVNLKNEEKIQIIDKLELKKLIKKDNGFILLKTNNIKREINLNRLNSIFKRL